VSRAVELQSLSAGYDGVEVLRDISLDIPEASLFATSLMRGFAHAEEEICPAKRHQAEGASVITVPRTIPITRPFLSRVH